MSSIKSKSDIDKLVREAEGDLIKAKKLVSDSKKMARDAKKNWTDAMENWTEVMENWTGAKELVRDAKLNLTAAKKWASVAGAEKSYRSNLKISVKSSRKVPTSAKKSLSFKKGKK